MDFKKLAPWNWFKKEENGEAVIPVQRPFSKKSHVQPSGSFLQLQRDMDKLFDNIAKKYGLSHLARQNSLLDTMTYGLLKPRLDIASDETEYTLGLEIPGVELSDIKLEVSDGTLTIKGDKRLEEEERKRNYYRIERSYGAFQRVLTLPDDSDQESIRASFKNGVLTVKIAKRAIAKTDMKQIEIK